VLCKDSQKSGEVICPRSIAPFFGVAEFLQMNVTDPSTRQRRRKRIFRKARTSRDWQRPYVNKYTDADRVKRGDEVI
jgi:hypothetical protein